MHINKTYKYLLIAILLITGSCSDDFLTETNPNTITTDSFWLSEDDFQRGLVTAYSGLQYASVGGGAMSVNENIRSDVGRSFDFYETSFAFSLLDWDASTIYINQRWQELYIGVFRCNQVIDNILAFEANADFTEEEKTNILGQARFLRALFYFWIGNSYRQVILQDKVPVEPEDFNKPLMDRSELFEAVIRPDLEFAIANLPREWDENNTGRATWGAATSLLAKAHLYRGDYADAARLFKEVIDSGIYSLTEDIGENFTTTGEFNRESIFEISFNATVNEGLSGTLKDDIGTQSGAEATIKARQAAPQLRGGFRVAVPTHWVHELYEDDRPDPTNPINTDNNFSRRAFWSIAFIDQDEGPYYQKESNIRTIADWFNGGAESCYWKKGTNWFNRSGEDNMDRSGINERVIRLADVYLMYAEALLMANGDASLNEALTYVDLVRSRAGVITLEQYSSDLSGRIPVLHKRGGGSLGHPVTTLNADALLTHIQFVERVLELSFEGVSSRWVDLVRWDLVEEAFVNMGEHVYTEDILNAATGEMEPVDNGILEFCGVTCPEPDPFFLGRAIVRYQNTEQQLSRYSPSFHDYFPVPITEINNNSSIQ